MNDEIREHFEHLFALIGECFNRMEMIVMSDGSDQSKVAILDEIGKSQENIRTASAFLLK